MSALTKLRNMIYVDYEGRAPESKKMFHRAYGLLPGGVSGNLRYFAPFPLYILSGDGCRVTDMDQSSYIDCFACNGPLLLGHKPAVLAEALKVVQGCGSMVLNPIMMVECAERLCRVIPSAERVRFLNSGTEAVISAVRYARAYTGKDGIVKFFGHYHGQDDQLLLGVAATRNTLGVGVPKGAIENTFTLPFNDITTFESFVTQHDDIAAVILDPAMHFGGLWGVDPEFLKVVRKRTSEADIVLIFDEVITGFRLGVGGAQGYFGVTPDLTILAKAMSAGERLGAVVGSAKVMSVTDPLAPIGTPRVFQSGTGNDATLALALANGAIAEYERLFAAGEYHKLWDRVENLGAFLSDIFGDYGIPLKVNRLASMMQLFITDKPHTFENAIHLDGTLLDLFYLALINHGVILSLPTSNHLYFSFAHDDAAFDEIKTKIRKVFLEYPFLDAYLELTSSFSQNYS